MVRKFEFYSRPKHCQTYEKEKREQATLPSQSSAALGSTPVPPDPGLPMTSLLTAVVTTGSLSHLHFKAKQRSRKEHKMHTKLHKHKST